MPNELTGKDILNLFHLNYLGGNDTWYTNANETIEGPITVNGAFANILMFARQYSLNIVPEAQNMTRYDETGMATVTLSPERMDVNVAGGGGTDYVETEFQVIVDAAYENTVRVGYPILTDDGITGEVKQVVPDVSTGDDTIIGGVIHFTTLNYSALNPDESTGLELVSAGYYKVIAENPTATFGGGK